MKNEAKIMDIVIIILMLSAIIIGISAFNWISSWYLLLAYLLAFIAIKIDMLERHSFVISKLDVRDPNAKWEYTLVYSYSIKWLKFLYFYELKIKKCYPIIYEFSLYEDFPKKEREYMLNKYFEAQV
jgi:hypothetical protein